MEKKTLYILALFLIFSINTTAQNDATGSIPQNIEIKTIDHEKVSSAVLQNENNPFIICFWKSCCKTSLNFLQAINDIYPDLQEEFGIKIFAISIDDARSSMQVKPTVSGNTWEFEVFLDANSDLKRAMNVNLTPHCLLYDQDHIIKWQKTVCMPGDEFVILEEIQKISDPNKIRTDE